MRVEQFLELPLLGILRGIEADDVAPLVETAVTAGLRAIEVTMNTPRAADLLRDMVRAARGRLSVGAGTVTDIALLETALGAGATFIVLPTLVRGVVDACVARSIPVFPGALTPSEIHAAWTAGATMVKVFPASCFGARYFREVKGPFGDVELLACGGVTPRTLPEYFAAGAAAAAFGGSVFSAERLRAHDFAVIGEDIRALVAACREALDRRDRPRVQSLHRQ